MDQLATAVTFDTECSVSSDEEMGASTPVLPSPPSKAAHTSATDNKSRRRIKLIAGASFFLLVALSIGFVFGRLSTGWTAENNDTTITIDTEEEISSADTATITTDTEEEISADTTPTSFVPTEESDEEEDMSAIVLDEEEVADLENSLMQSTVPSIAPSISSSSVPSANPVTKPPTPFFMGDEFYTNEELGIEISAGLSVRLIAKTGETVKYANGGNSALTYHTKSDAAGIIPMNAENPLEDGYVYVINSEEGDGLGGVYGIYFDREGNILEYKALLTGTTDNCGGGISPWNTFISCEEYEDGQCWQIDPVNERAEATELGGKGGRYESVAVDNRNPENPVFFTTEDHEEGALRRFEADGNGWDALHSDGDHSFLRILNDNEFEWTEKEKDARKSAEEYYPKTEGIQFHEGKLYFMAKQLYKLFILDLETMTYETEQTGLKFYGEGSFGDQPDQNLFGPTRKYQYFTEDGGDSCGVYARFEDGTYFTMFQAIPGGFIGVDETVGIALSPDHKKFYAGIQDIGYIFEFTRDDGLPFE